MTASKPTTIMHEELRSTLANPKAYPLELTLADGRKLLVARPALFHFPPRLKNIVYFPPRKKDGLMEFIAPESVLKIRTCRRKRAA